MTLVDILMYISETSRDIKIEKKKKDDWNLDDWRDDHNSTSVRNTVKSVSIFFSEFSESLITEMSNVVKVPLVVRSVDPVENLLHLKPNVPIVNESHYLVN